MEGDELRLLQGLPLDLKVAKTMLRIEEWYRYWGGKVYVSFSGGKDSTVLLHIARSMYPDIKAVFIDTGLEYPEVREFVKTIPNVTILRPRMPFTEVIKKYGHPVISKEQSQYIYEVRRTKSEKLKNVRLNGGKNGAGKIANKWKFLIDAPFKISHMCCKIMKKEPVIKFEKEMDLKPILGVMTEESVLRKKNYLKNGCNSFEGKRPISTPMGFWREQDIWDYIKTYKIPYSKIYDKGLNRTGCMFCCYGIQYDEKGNNRFQLMQRIHPKQYEYCMNKLGIAEVLDYIGIEYGTQMNIKDYNL